MAKSIKLREAHANRALSKDASQCYCKHPTSIQNATNTRPASGYTRTDNTKQGDVIKLSQVQAARYQASLVLLRDHRPKHPSPCYGSRLFGHYHTPVAGHHTPASLLGHLHGLNGLSQGANLVDLQQQGVHCLLLDASLHAGGVGHQHVITNHLLNEANEKKLSKHYERTKHVFKSAGKGCNSSRDLAIPGGLRVCKPNPC